jgi:chaperonin cofactor prefoldin
MSEEQMRAVMEYFAKESRAAAEQSAMVGERLTHMHAEINKRFDESAAQLQHFAGAVHQRFDKLETRVGGLETRVGGLETRVGGLEAFARDTQQRLERIEGHLQLKAPRTTRTPPRASRTSSLTKRYKKS